MPDQQPTLRDVPVVIASPGLAVLHQEILDAGQGVRLLGQRDLIDHPTRLDVPDHHIIERFLHDDQISLLRADPSQLLPAPGTERVWAIVPVPA